MLFFYIRHGDPIYEPDSLTPLGERQAEAAAKRLALYGIDKIYASSSERAKLTAKPTCELLKKEFTELDWCNESHAWNELTYNTEKGKRWLFHSDYARKILTSSEIISMGYEWYKHPEFKSYNYKAGLDRIRNESDKFFSSLGYEHIAETGKYKVITQNNDRVALFAHQGFGLAFLSLLLDIPYPLFAMHFDICHTGITVINFEEIDGYAIPKVLTLSTDSHIYREGLPTNYNNSIRF